MGNKCIIWLAIISSIYCSVFQPRAPSLSFKARLVIPLNTDPPVILESTDSITAVFTRPVIPLGSSVWEADALKPLLWKCGDDEERSTSPVAGNLRWVTTSVLRFDPKTQWANDLTCSVRINPELTTYDNVAFESTPDSSIEFRTQPLNVIIQTVTSRLASILTEGYWRSQWEDNEAHECPTDAIITILFSSSIDKSQVVQQLKLYESTDKQQPTGSPRPLTLAPPDKNSKDFDKTDDDKKIRVSVPTLVTGKQYLIRLPAGSVVSKISGPTKVDIDLKVQGLVPFTIQWSRSEWTVIRHTNLRIHLRHGLSDWTEMKSFKHSFHVFPEHDFNITRVDRNTINLRGYYQPHVSYTIVMWTNKKVVDQFGLHFHGNRAEIKTAPLNTIMALPSTHYVTPNSRTPNYTILGRGLIPAYDPKTWKDKSCSGRKAYIYEATLDEIESILHCKPPVSANGKQYGPARPGHLGHYGDTIEYWNLPVQNFTNTTGMAVLIETYGVEGPWEPGCQTFSTHTCHYYSTSPLGLSSISINDQLGIWATNISNSKPIPGVTIHLYGTQYNKESKLSATAKTDSNGLALFKLGQEWDYKTISAFSDHEGKLTMLSVSHRRSHTPKTQADLLVERALYRGGETIHLKGYVQVYDQSGKQIDISQPSKSVPNFFVNVRWNSRINVTISKSGEFSLDIDIPADTKHGSYAILLYSAIEGEHDSLEASQYINIADPRLPTGILELNSEALICPPTERSIPITIATKTYLGGPSKDSQVTLKWSIGSEQNETKLMLPLGTIDHVLTLPESAFVSNNKGWSTTQEVNIEVEWFTPARDRLSQSLTIPVRLSSWWASIDVSGRAIPKYPYLVTVKVDASKPKKIISSEYQINIRVFQANNTKETLLHKIEKELAELFEKADPLAQPIVNIEDSHITASTHITLNDVGKYLVIAQYYDENGNARYTHEVVGNTADEWRLNPLTEWYGISTPEFLTKQHHVGDTVELKWLSPFLKSTALLVWGDGQGNAQSQVYELEKGDNVLKFKIGQECILGCHVTGMVCTPPHSPITLPVPHSPLLDTSLPQMVSLSSLEVHVVQPNRTLDVHVSLPNYVNPGKATEIEIHAKVGTTAARNGKATVWVVDQSLIDVHPHSWPPKELEVARPFKFAEWWADFRSIYNDLTSADIIEKATHNVIEIIKGNPWVWDAPIPFRPGRGLDLGIDDFLDQGYDTLTPSIWKDGVDTVLETAAYSTRSLNSPMMTMNSMSMDLGGSGGSGEKSVTVRTNFQATPIFKTEVSLDENGRVKIPFLPPDNLGTWTVRAVVHSTDNNQLHIGTAEAKTVSRNPVSLIASVPRQVRVGDNFFAGCTVNSIDDGEALLRITLSSVDTNTAIELVGTNEKSVHVSAETPLEVVFEFKSIKVGTTKIQFTVELGEWSDSFIIDLDSVGLQLPVFIASSFAVTTESDREEKIELPDAVVGSGILNISAGVGRYPALSGISQSLLKHVNHQLNSQGKWAYTRDLVSVIALPTIYESYGIHPSQPIFGETINLQKKALSYLLEVTKYPDGLPEMPPQFITVPWPAPELNAYAIYVIKRSKVLTSDTSVQRAIALWTDAAWAPHTNVDGKTVPDYEGLASVYFALGSDATPRKAPGHDISFNTVIKNYKNLSLTSMAKLLLTSTQSPESSEIAQTLYSHLRVQGRTAYVSTQNSRALPLGSQALVLSALIKSNEYSKDDQLLEKLANYVASGQDYQSVTCLPTLNSQDAVYRIFAIQDYDTFLGSSKPDLTLTVKVQESARVLLQRKFDGSEQPSAELTHRWNDLSSKSYPTLSFTGIGKGQATVSLGLEFVPALVPKDPIYSGIYVEKSISLLYGNGTLTPIKPEDILTPGQIVQVTLQILTPDDLSGGVIAVEPLASCLEAFENVPTASPRRTLFNRHRHSHLEHIHFYPTAAEVRKDQVTFISSYLPAGTHSWTYQAVVVTSGQFTVPPAKVYASQQPEVMGLSNSLNIQVALPRR